MVGWWKYLWNDPVWSGIPGASLVDGAVRSGSRVFAVRRPLMDSQLKRSSESLQWLRLIEKQTDKLSTILNALGRLKVLAAHALAIGLLTISPRFA